MLGVGKGQEPNLPAGADRGFRRAGLEALDQGRNRCPVFQAASKLYSNR